MELLLGPLLFLSSAFFSATETAVYRANWIRLTEWAGRRVAGAGAALRVLDRHESSLVTILIGNNLVNTFASVIFTGFFARTFGPAWTSVAVLLVVIVTMVVGEYVPKSLARAWPNRFLSLAAPVLLAFGWVVWPVTLLLLSLARIRRGSGPGRRFTLTRQDFIAALARRESSAAGHRPASVAALARRLFRFSGCRVADIAIPLAQVKSVRADAGLNEIAALVAEHGYSRIPVWEKTPDNITGVVVVKDLLAAPARRIRRVLRVGETTRALEVMRLMQQRGDHMAALHDATGRVTGIVTLEDLLEELVGEIRSEA